MKQLLQRNNPTSLISAATVFVSRLGALPANVSPLGSYGFFGNAWLYVASIALFDLAVKGIYPGVLFTYAGFTAYPLFGKIAGKSVQKQLALLPLASFLFFLLSNFGVWWYWYDHTFTKLLTCYALALPFYGRTLLSDLTFGYGFILWKHREVLRQKLSSFAVVQRKTLAVN